MPDRATRIRTRLARPTDIAAIRQVFLDTYGDNYAYPQFYDEAALLGMVHADDVVVTVAEDEATSELVGTASVVEKVGGWQDLLGEMGRLAVRPPDRNRGVGTALMGERLRQASGRLEVVYAENRTAHPYSQRISRRHGFVPVGLLPRKCRLARREHLSLWVHYLGSARSLRLPQARVLPEIRALAELALRSTGFPADVEVVQPAATEPGRRLVFEELCEATWPEVLALAWGRLDHRAVFGPVGVADGLPRLLRRSAQVLVARETPGAPVLGALVLVHDFAGQGLRLSEVVSTGPERLRDLVEQGLARALRSHQVDYEEVDLSAVAPGTQRLFVDLGFFPVAYVPAMRFDRTGRRDIVKLARVREAPAHDKARLLPEAEAVSALVLAGYRS